MNVFDVGISITLLNRVTPGLALIAGQFAKTETAAAALQSQIGKIGSALGNAAALAGVSAVFAAPLIAATHASKEYLHQLNLMNTAGMSQKELAESTTAAWATAKQVMGTTATGNLEITSDLKTVLGSVKEANAMMPKMAEMQVAMNAVLGGRYTGQMAKDQNFAAAKSADMLGKVRNKEEMSRTMDDLFRVSVATLGRVMPTDQQATLKYAKLARYGWSDDYRNKVLPELMVEAKGKGGGTQTVGTQSMALYRFGYQGVMNKKSLEQLQALNLAPLTGHLKTTTTGTTLDGGVTGKDLLASNPFQWVQKVLRPALVKKYGTENNDILALKSSQIFKSNAGARNLVAEFLKKPQQYERFGPSFDKAKGVHGAYADAVKNDPNTNAKLLQASLENLGTAVGQHVTPIITALTNKLAGLINKLAMFANEHPRITKTVVALTAAASGLFAIGAAANVCKAAFGGLKIIFGPIGSKIKALAGLFKGPLLSGMSRIALTAMRFIPQTALIVAGITAVVLVLANWKSIMRVIHDHADFLTVVLYKADTAFDQVAKTVQEMIGKIGSSLGGLVDAVKKNPLVKMVTDAASPVANAVGAATKQVIDKAGKEIAKATTVDKAELAKAKAYEMQKGRAGVVNWLYGRGGETAVAKPSLAASGSAARNSGNGQTVQHNHITNHFNVHGANDPKKAAHEIMRHLDNVIRHGSMAATTAGGTDVSRHNNGT